MNEIIESAEYTKAVTLHRRICANAQAAQESLYEMCKSLKEMRDGKLYKELGYESFENYAETEVGMTKRNANRYVSIADMLSKNGTPVSPKLGVTKLYLLSTLSEEEITEVVQSTDIDSVSKRELESKIADLKKANDRLMDKVDEAEKDTAALEALQKENDERINALQSSHTAELERLKTEYESKLKNISEKEEIIDTKEVFKAYLSNAIDASKRLLEFINANPDEIFKEKARSLFETMQKEVI